jgi:hypothetical protein
VLEHVAEELRELHFATRIVEFPSFPVSGQAVVIDVNVEHGRYKGQTLTVGLSFQENAYPEYPPHFVHFKSSVSTDIATRHSMHNFECESWAAYSLPPNDFWDGLESSQKNMNTYVRRHLFRVIARL